MDLLILVGVMCRHENDSTKPRGVVWLMEERGEGDHGEGLSPAAAGLKLGDGNSGFVISFPVALCRLAVCHHMCV